ncbi:MAG: 2-C-methyl-D-erythritol 4-phosphate cytidylyltransferase [Cellvibrionales bacterium]|nr:2-C-methyl-D-erythritol 4-phosphate cytidylyltransferase [Cellvibrionales bacterium]
MSDFSDLSDHSPLWVVIPCAGSGSRMQQSTPKQYLPLLDATVIEATLSCFTQRVDVKHILIAVDDQARFLDRVQLPPKVSLVDGGLTRAESVQNALSMIADENALVAVHDAARPCLRQSRLDQLFLVAQNNAQGALFVEPCAQTAKRVIDRQIIETLDRSSIYFSQTPQVFPLALLQKAFQQVELSAVTDECQAIESLGFTPAMVESDKENIKITYPIDLYIAEQLLLKIREDES